MYLCSDWLNFLGCQLTQVVLEKDAIKRLSMHLLFHDVILYCGRIRLWKYVVTDLIEDWSTKSKPDIYHFVPYTWHLDIVLKEFELTTLTNEWNWIDCFGQTPENGKLCSLVLLDS